VLRGLMTVPVQIRGRQHRQQRDRGREHDARPGAEAVDESQDTDPSAQAAGRYGERPSDGEDRCRGAAEDAQGVEVERSHPDHVFPGRTTSHPAVANLTRL
jgi:hypothetical protein